jgi:hypothetical protein
MTLLSAQDAASKKEFDERSTGTAHRGASWWTTKRRKRMRR